MSIHLGRAAVAAALIALLAVMPAAGQQDRRVRIHNDTSITMRQFFASNVDRDTWEEDILGSDVLEPGQSILIDIDDGSGACLFDFKAVFEGGAELISEEAQNVCEISDYRYTD